jgi:hypothetical protein
MQYAFSGIFNTYPFDLQKVKDIQGENQIKQEAVLKIERLTGNIL